jgi:hypothetical protein
MGANGWRVTTGFHLKQMHATGFQTLHVDLSATMECTRSYLTISANMSGTLPEELWLLSGLISLTLLQHRPEGTLPTRIGKMSQFEKLALYELSISGSIPSEIGHTNGKKTSTFGL